MILICISIVIVSITYISIVMPLLPLLLLKLKLGNKAILMFKPISGFFGILMNSREKHREVLKSVDLELIKNPKAVVVLSNLFHKPFLVFTSPDYIKQIYLDHNDFLKTDPINMPRLTQKGLVMSEGEAWKRQRKFLGISFTFEKLKSRIPMINQVVEDISNDDPKTNVTSFLSRITGEVVIQSFFGELAKGLTFEGKPAQVSVQELSSDLSQITLISPFVLVKKILLDEKSWDYFLNKEEKKLLQRCNNLISLVKPLIEQRISQLKEKPLENKESMVFLDLYVTEYLNQLSQNNSTIDLEEVIHQFITLFVAGTDTTATTCGTALYFLAKYPEIQEEILEEINTVIGDNEVTDAHLNKLVRIGGLIQEVLRFKNPAFAAIIRIVKQDKQLMDVKLKKGWFAIQYHSASSIKNEHFDNPNVFDYKRWISEGEVIKNDNGFVHIPFAAGPRNCIGQHMAQMEAKIMIALLIRKYQVELNPEVKDIYFDLKLLQCIAPDNYVVFKERLRY